METVCCARVMMSVLCRIRKWDREPAGASEKESKNKKRLL